jgi:hypothetical protein
MKTSSRIVCVFVVVLAFIPLVLWLIVDVPSLLLIDDRSRLGRESREMLQPIYAALIRDPKLMESLRDPETAHVAANALRPSVERWRTQGRGNADWSCPCVAIEFRSAADGSWRPVTGDVQFVPFVFIVRETDDGVLAGPFLFTDGSIALTSVPVSIRQTERAGTSAATLIDFGDGFDVSPVRSVKVVCIDMLLETSKE